MVTQFTHCSVYCYHSNKKTSSTEANMSAQRKDSKEEEDEEPLSEEEGFEEAARKVVSPSTLKRNSELPQQATSHIPEVADDFLRNFLRRAGLTQTLRVFEAEWTEKLQREPPVTAKTGMSFIPDALTHRQLLQSELDAVCRETDTLRREVMEAGERTVRTQRETDFYQLQYRRAAEDKKELTDDIKQLKKHLESYEPALRQLDEKYQTALRQKMLITLERDRSRSSPEARLKQEHLQIKKETCIGASNSSNRASARSRVKRHSQDSEFPLCSRQVNTQPAQVTPQRWKGPGSFSLAGSIRAHQLPISCISLHPQGLMLASASVDRSWRLWPLPANGAKVGQAMTGEGHSDWLSGCRFHPDGTKLATTSGDATLRLWDVSLGCCVLTLSGHCRPTWGCSFHSCGHFLASCSADGTAKLWDLNSERCRSTLRGHTASVNSVSFQPSSNLLLTCSTDKTLALWDARLGICTATFHGHQRPCNSAAFGLSADLVASCDVQGAIKLWDVRKPPSAVATVDVGPSAANQVAFSPSGKMLAAASSDGSVRLVGTDSCAVTSLLGHSESVQSVTFDHREETVMSAGSDGLVNMWM